MRHRAPDTRACRQRDKRSCTQSAIVVETIERAVARYYSRVDYDEEDIEGLREKVERHSSLTSRLVTKELSRQRTRIEQLEAERRSLLRAHYADAVPLDLLREEQARIKGEIGAAERIIRSCEVHFADARRGLDRALALLDHPHDAYERAEPRVRRHYNRSLFERLYVADEEIVGADLAPPYFQLLDPGLDDLLERELAIEPVPAVSGFGIEEEAEHAYERQPVGAGMARARERRVSPVERPHGLTACWPENERTPTPTGVGVRA